MRSLDELNGRLSHTTVKPTIDNDRLRIYVRQNKFIAGHIILSEKTFYNVQRSVKNLFLLFGSPGLGINSELLNVVFPALDIKQIIITYEGEELITTVSKWKRLGITSPFADGSRIDKQVILDMNEINLKHTEKYFEKPEEKNQLSLFEAA